MSSTEHRRSATRLLDLRLPRRLLTIPATLLALVVAAALFPMWLVGCLVADLIRRDRLLRRTRALVLITGALIIETIGIFSSVIMWAATGFGTFRTQRRQWQRYRRYMGLYTSALLTLVARVLGTRVEWRGGADLTSGPVILVARHTSFFDALIPNTLLSRRNRLLGHHVVTQGLRFSPCIDIVGHRVPMRFIRRTPGEGSAELGPIAALGAVLDERSACVIFPEGTFRTPDRFDRAVRRLRRRSPELADRAARLEHVLPPRASGTHSLLAGAPTADIVICTNIGFEPFGSLKSILSSPIAHRPIVVESWRIPRSEIPEAGDAFGEWLFERFVEIDRWVADEHAARQKD